MIRRHRILVIGRNGQLARALADAEWPNLSQVQFAGRDEIDLFHAVQLRQQLSSFNPEAIINTAGYANIEQAELKPEAAFALNAEAAHVLATAAAMLDIPLLHLSSAHVFSGNKTEAYREGDRTEPLSVYGQSMLAGESAVQRARGRHLILRSSRFFGRHGDNFLKTMLAQGRDARELSFTASGFACPTPVDALADMLPHIAIALIEGRRFAPILHYAGDSAASWYEIATEVFSLARNYQPVPELVPLEMPAEAGAPARASNLSLDCSMARNLGLPKIDWRAALPPLVEALCNPLSNPVADQAARVPVQAA